MLKNSYFLCIPAILALILSGCKNSTGSYTSFEYVKTPYVGNFERKNIKYEGIKRNPLIIVHGFLGASLIDIKTNQNVWGSFHASEAMKISDEKLKGITHPIGKGKKLSELKDDIIANRLLETVQINVLGTSFEEKAYKNMIDILEKAGYVSDSRPIPSDKNFYSMFLFPYDWRRDLPENAVKLGEFIEEKRKYMQIEYEKNYGIKNYDVQFDIIAHSMGGLVSRYYLQYGKQDLPNDDTLPKITWEGSKYIDRVVIVGTPNAGYLDTFLEMSRGTTLPPYPPAALGTLPTYYQMLPPPNSRSFLYSDDPNGEEIDIFEYKIWEKYNWSIADQNQDKVLQKLLPDIKNKEERHEIALDHLQKCLLRAKKFIEAMEVEASPPDDVKLYLVFGYGIKTSQTVLINRKSGNIEKVEYGTGDGKVLSVSALWDKNIIGQNSHFLKTPIDWAGIYVLRGAHMAITEQPAFADNIVFILTLEETTKQTEILKKVDEN